MDLLKLNAKFMCACVQFSGQKTCRFHELENPSHESFSCQESDPARHRLELEPLNHHFQVQLLVSLCKPLPTGLGQKCFASMGTLPRRNNASFEKRSHITDNVLPKDQDPKCDLDYSQVPLLSPVQCSLTACGAHRNMNLQRPLLVPKGGTAVTELGLLCTLFILLQSQTPSFLSSFL